MKTSAEIETGMGPGKQTLDTEMSNYKQVGGVMLPHTVRQFMNGNKMAEVSVIGVEFNSPVDDSIFSMPKK